MERREIPGSDRRWTADGTGMVSDYAGIMVYNAEKLCGFPCARPYMVKFLATSKPFQGGLRWNVHWFLSNPMGCNVG